MKNLGFVCVALVAVMFAVVPARAAQEESPFTLVQRVGEPHYRLHMFTTSAGKYTIRHDGFGEVYIAGRKQNFHLKAGPKAPARIEWVYFYWYQGDLLLLYRTGASGYFVQLDEKTRKIKSTRVLKPDFEPPVIQERSLVFSDGTIVPLT